MRRSVEMIALLKRIFTGLTEAMDRRPIGFFLFIFFFLRELHFFYPSICVRVFPIDSALYVNRDTENACASIPYIDGNK